ncbi:MAG TPA: Crp/Fnr family transcriptional regulator [Rhodoferax sp.]|jgi:CRP-like cAMP-binding protein|nr:Crp/Fnr family transcriptional regulator [Rhodoferax sp.]HPW83426.1 Crp/Fnr family transcriptional regulator [Rhodoferax sp.]HQC86513.1 Crp/Fnr family transcriptional regulator [Rhodoferax sp.]HQY75532.1 Crp/Fnr family transcriptional regulator [Rhodoferax sp.]
MALLSNLELIRRVPLFAQLSTSQAEALVGAVTKQRFKRGECIVTQGQTSNALFILLTGRARVLMSDKRDREVILASMQAGDHVGEMSLIDGEPHSATVQAEIMTDTLVLGRKDFLRCLSENSAMAHSVMRELVHRLRVADHKIGSLALMGVYARVANVMLESAVADTGGGLLIPHKVSRQDVAKMVGASREMVSRVMKDFEEQGFLQTLDQGLIRVHDRRQAPR